MCKSKNVTSDMCVQRRLKPACPSAQSERYSLSTWCNFAYLVSQNAPAEILIRLRECSRWSESSLSAHVQKHVFWAKVLSKIKKLHRCVTNYGDVIAPRRHQNQCHVIELCEDTRVSVQYQESVPILNDICTRAPRIFIAYFYLHVYM